jgi:tol-pal system protein YbgF
LKKTAILILLCFSYKSLWPAQPTPAPTDNLRVLYDQAQKLFNEKNYKEAKTLLSQVVAKASPADDFLPKARLLLANLQEDFTVSTMQFETLAAEYVDQPTGEEAQKDLGARYYLADKYEEAADSYKDFLEHYEKSPLAPEVHYWYASSILALDKNKEAIEEFKKVFEKSPDSPWAPKALLGMGNAYFKLKKYEDARKQYLKIMDQYHYYDEMNLVYLKLGEAYEAEQKFKEAHAAFQTLLEKFPKSLEVSEAKDRMLELEKSHPDLPQTMTALKATSTATPVPVVAQPVTAEVQPTAEAEVSVEEQPEVSKPFHVQVGVFSKKFYVEKAQKEVKRAGYRPYVVLVKAKDVPYPMYKVRVGKFTDKASAQRLANELTRKLKEKAIVVED